MHFAVIEMPLPRAAARLDNPAVTWRQPATVTRRHFWLPVEAGKAVELPRRLSDDEWTQLVVDLRTTFDARGRIVETSTRREWRSSSARALLERTDTGERFHLHTTRRHGITVFATMAGIGIFATTAARLRSWARFARQQVDGVVARLLAATTDRDYPRPS